MALLQNIFKRYLIINFITLSVLFSHNNINIDSFITPLTLREIIQSILYEEKDAEKDTNVYKDFLPRIDNIEILLNDDFNGYLYVGRDTCPFCIQFHSYLKIFLLENKDIEIYFFDTDYWRQSEHFRSVIEKFNLETVPIMIKISEDGTYKKSSPNLENSELTKTWFREFFSY